MKKIFVVLLFLVTSSFSQTQIDDHLDRTGTQLMNMTIPGDVWLDSTYFAGYPGEVLKDIIAFLDSTIIEKNYGNPSKDSYYDIISFLDPASNPDSIRVSGSDTTYVDGATKTTVFFEEYYAFSDSDTSHVFRRIKPPQNYTGIDTVDIGHMTISNVSGTVHLQVLGALFKNGTAVPLLFTVLDEYNITVPDDSTFYISQRSGSDLTTYETFWEASKYFRLALCIRRTPGHASDTMSGDFLIRDIVFKYD